MTKSLLPHIGDRLFYSTTHPYKDVLLQMMGEKDCLFFWAVEKAPTRDEFTEENKCNLFLGEARAFCWVFQYRYQGVHKRFPASILFANIWKMSKIDTIDGQKIIFFCQLEYSQNISDIPPLPACTFQNQAFFCQVDDQSFTWADICCR